jgi:hypothetical protein
MVIVLSTCIVQFLMARNICIQIEKTHMDKLMCHMKSCCVTYFQMEVLHDVQIPQHQQVD